MKKEKVHIKKSNINSIDNRIIQMRNVSGVKMGTISQMLERNGIKSVYEVDDDTIVIENPALDALVGAVQEACSEADGSILVNMRDTIINQDLSLSENADRRGNNQNSFHRGRF